MDSLRMAPPNSVPLSISCCRCDRDERCWDRIAGKAYCPNCQELLAMGESAPLVEPTQTHHCAVCQKRGTVCFLSFPLHAETPIAMDLCPEHLRALVGRRLTSFAFNQLRRQIHTLGLEVDDLFLLHGAFYDTHGRALQPAIDSE